MNVLDSIASHIDKCGTVDIEDHPFYHFEPWDVDPRPDWVMEQARKDCIDMYNEEIIKHIGADPHLFQTGYLMSDAFIKVLLAGSQVGKSYSALIGAICELTGEFPISMRYDKGVDTGVKRKINQDNVRRFGRISKETGLIIDHDVTIMRGVGVEWDCGNITGAGRFPSHMVSSEGSEIWLCTYMKAMTEYWWPKFAEIGKMIIPEHLIDKSRGGDGYSKKENTVYLIRNTNITIITYESGYQRVEAQKVWRIILDEEPTDQRFYQASLQHCRYLSLVMTPYNGITYTRAILFPSHKSKDVAVFHATQYDSPYQSRNDIELRRTSMNQWDIGSRVWGFHTEATGKPYYDRAKINLWIQRYSNRESFEVVDFYSTKPWFGMYSNPDISMLQGLMEIPVKRKPSTTGWKMFEDVKKGVGYLYSADTAEGADNPEDVGDNNAGYITRAFTIEERIANKGIKEGSLFKIVASRRTGIKTEDFARESLIACRYYNNALLACETKRGFSNATFMSVAKDWPHWYKHISVNDASRTPREDIGFDTNVSTRYSLFDLIRDNIAQYSEDEYPYIPDLDLMIELSGAVVGKNGRCDHEKRRGSLDNALAYGISFYVWKNAPEQIACNSQEEEPEPRRNPRIVLPKKQDHCGMGQMGYGSRT